jgi:hypothetical protein
MVSFPRTGARGGTFIATEGLRLLVRAHRRLGSLVGAIVMMNEAKTRA